MRKIGIIVFVFFVIVAIDTFARDDNDISQIIQNTLKQEHNSTTNKRLFYRIGIGSMDVEGGYLALDFNLGLHYYLHGFNKDGFGLGLSYNSSRKYKEDSRQYCFSDTNCKKVDTFEKVNIKYIELLYNFDLGQDFYLALALIKGQLATKTEIDNDHQKETLYNETFDIGGFGFYFTLPDIKKRKCSASLYIKSLVVSDSEKSNMTLAGVQFVW